MKKIIQTLLICSVIFGAQSTAYLSTKLPKLEQKPKIVSVKEELPDVDKIYNMIFDLRPDIEDKLAKRISSAIVKNANKYDLEPELITAIIYKESTFDPKAESSVKAKGLMQVYPKFHKEKLKARKITRDDLYNIKHNIDVGCEILREYIDEEGNIWGALRNYSGNKRKKSVYVKEVMNMYIAYSKEG